MLGGSGPHSAAARFTRAVGVSPSKLLLLAAGAFCLWLLLAPTVYDGTNAATGAGHRDSADATEHANRAGVDVALAEDDVHADARTEADADEPVAPRKPAKRSGAGKSGARQPTHGAAKNGARPPPPPPPPPSPPPPPTGARRSAATTLLPSDGLLIPATKEHPRPYSDMTPPWPADKLSAKPTKLPPLPPTDADMRACGADPYRNPWLADRLDRGIDAGPLTLSSVPADVRLPSDPPESGPDSPDAVGNDYRPKVVGEEATGRGAGSAGRGPPTRLAFARSQLMQPKSRRWPPEAYVPLTGEEVNAFYGVHKHDWLLHGIVTAMAEHDPLLWESTGGYFAMLNEARQGASLAEELGRVANIPGDKGGAALVLLPACNVFGQFETLKNSPHKFVLITVGDQNFGAFSDNLRHTASHHSLESRLGGCGSVPGGGATGERAHDSILRVAELPNLLTWFVSQDVGIQHPKIHGLPLGPGQPSSCNTLIRNGYGTEPLIPALQRYLRASAEFVARYHTLSAWEQARGTRPYLLNINNSGWRHREHINNLVMRRFAEEALKSRAAGTSLEDDEMYIRNGYDMNAVEKNAVKAMDAMRDDMLTHKYVLSPMGAGQDTYRHWEAILLGCIPVMTHSSLDHLFLDLPVLLVDHYDQVTPQFLLEMYPKIVARFAHYHYGKLTQRYWHQLVRGHKHREPLTKEQSAYDRYVPSKWKK